MYIFAIRYDIILDYTNQEPEHVKSHRNGKECARSFKV